MADVNSNKIALVTGGSRGLGKDIALSLARDGTGVIITYHAKAEDAAQVVADIRALGAKATALQLDVGQLSTLDAFVTKLQTVLKEQFGADRLDFLVNNAGMGKAIPIEKLSIDEFDLFLNVHFKGVVFLTQKTLAIMNDGGSVVFITAAGDRYYVPGYAVYSSCKGAIEVFSRYVAKEFGPRAIRANTVAPGGIVTDFANAAIRGNPQLQAHIKEVTAMGRLGYADDIGGVVAFLCSHDSKWVTGQRLEVTGGYNL